MDGRRVQKDPAYEERDQCGGEQDERAPTHAHFEDPCAAVSLLSSAIEVGFGLAGCVARKTPSAHISGVRPSLSLTSRRAPFSARNAIMSSDPRLPPPCNAVSPIGLNAFTSPARYQQ